MYDDANNDYDQNGHLGVVAFCPAVPRPVLAPHKVVRPEELPVWWRLDWCLCDHGDGDGVDGGGNDDNGDHGDGDDDNGDNGNGNDDNGDGDGGDGVDE